jgi:hypothetical protein
MLQTRLASKRALFFILLLLIFHWIFITPVIRRYRTRIPTADPWRKGADVLTQLRSSSQLNTTVFLP